MYLVSAYFGKKTEQHIQSYINDVATQCGNAFMVDNRVPPHMTISAFETLHEKEIIAVLNNAFADIRQNKIEWVTVGTFPTVIFIQPVLNEGLHHISCAIYNGLKDLPDTKVSKYYKPFSWLPHATIAKQLSEEEMRKAFDVLHKSFKPFKGEIVRIEFAKKNPYRVIASWELENE